VDGLVLLGKEHQPKWCNGSSECDDAHFTP
jgi:hypothetical protein